MERPVKVQVEKVGDSYNLSFVDELSGSATGVTIPENGYKALAEHFRSGEMEVSSDSIKQHLGNAWGLPDGIYRVAVDRAAKGSKDYTSRIWMREGISGEIMIVAEELLK